MQVSEESTIYKELAELLPQTVFEIDLQGNLTFGNKSGLKMFGYTMADFKKGLNVLNMIVPDERQKATEDIKAVIEKGKGFGSEYTALKRDGTTFSVIIYSSRIIKKKQNVGLRGIIVDITDRKRIEAELKESEYKFRNFAEKSLVGIYLIQDDVFKYVNSTFAEIFGYAVDEIVNIITPGDLASREFTKKVSENITKRLLGKEDSVHYQFKGIRKDKKIIDIEVYGSRTIIHGKPAIVGSLIDITERKKAESELKNISKRNEIILRTAADGFHIINEKGEIINVNPAFCEMTGFTENKLISRPVNSLYIHPGEDILFRIKQIAEGKSPFLETTLKRKDSTSIDVEMSCNMLNLEDESLYFLSVRNVTERKFSEQKIGQLSRAVEQSPVSIIITNTDGVIEYVNPKFCDITGYTFGEVIGEKPSLLKSGEQDVKFYKELWDTIKSGGEWRGELHNKKKNGDLYWEHASISPIKNAKGDITHFLAVKEDITEKKYVENELRAAKEKAEEINRLKSSFLANMNHELRTPLIGILGFADILMEELKNPEQKEMANTILESGQRLLESLNMILDLSRLETDRLEFDFKPVNIGESLKEEVKRFTHIIKNKKLEFSFNINDDVFSRLDESIFKQVVKNLLNNAIKFTKSGSISLDVLTENNAAGSFSVVRVSDTGIGIAKEDQKVIFEEFRQAREGFNRPYEGTGLGLTITKKFVELMGGRIELFSEKDKGSAFTIRFPLFRHNVNTVYSEPVVNIKDQVFARPRILSVENDMSSVKIIRYFLKNLCTIEHAETGEDALKLIESNRYSAVLMDINLGAGISGLDTVREIKRFPHCRNIPIIAVTAYAFPSDKEKFLKNGCTHYLSKPFERSSIVQLMTEILHN
ncbi:MAG: PAS domain S-box protein [Ignavibacteriaceae bacterium]